MTGTAIQIMSRQIIDLSNGISGPPLDVMIADRFSVVGYTQGELYARIHGGTIGSPAVVNILAYQTAPSAEDPSQDFVLSSPLAANLSIDSTDVSGAPKLIRAVLSSGFGGALRIFIRASQSGSIQTIAPELSVELVLKC